MGPVICLSNCYEPNDSSMHVTLPCSQMAREGPHSDAACICLFNTNGTIEFTTCVCIQSACGQKYLAFPDKPSKQSLSFRAFITFLHAWLLTNQSLSRFSLSCGTQACEGLRINFSRWKYLFLWIKRMYILKCTDSII